VGRGSSDIKSQRAEETTTFCVVSDTGVGLPFSRPTKLSMRSYHKPHGTGMGLSHQPLSVE